MSEPRKANPPGESQASNKMFVVQMYSINGEVIFTSDPVTKNTAMSFVFDYGTLLKHHYLRAIPAEENTK